VTNPKGGRHERSRLDWLRDQGVNVVRVHDGGTRDEGDLRVTGKRLQRFDRIADYIENGAIGDATYAVQCKAYRNLADGINAAMRDLPEQTANAGADFGVALIRRHGKPNPEDDLVVMRLADFVRTGLWL